MIGEIYFVQAEKGPIKVGFSLDVPRRVSQLQGGLREAMTVLATMPGDRRTEAYLHHKLRPHRIVGEWFHPAEAVLSAASEALGAGLMSVPPEFRPLPEYEEPAADEDDTVATCRQFCVTIAGPRVGSERVSDLIERVSKMAGLGKSEIKKIWYREVNSIKASTYLRLQELFEAEVAVSLSRNSALRIAPWIAETTNDPG